MAPSTNASCCTLRVDGFSTPVRVVRRDPGPLTGESVLTLEDARGNRSCWRTVFYLPDDATGQRFGTLTCGGRR